MTATSDTTQDVLTHHDAQLVGTVALTMLALWVAGLIAWAVIDECQQRHVWLRITNLWRLHRARAVRNRQMWNDAGVGSFRPERDVATVHRIARNLNERGQR